MSEKSVRNPAVFYKKYIYIIIFFFIIILLFLTIIGNKENLNVNRLDRAISNGLDFLYKNQLPYGEFRTYSSYKNNMDDCCFDSSPFVTTFVLYSTGFIDDRRVEVMKEKGLKFFLEEMEEPGIWSFWTSRNNRKIDPDLDDTSCISYLLKKNEISTVNNLELIYKNVNNEGIFHTWIRNPDMDNDIDCVVNANVLLYLGENDKTVVVTEFLNNIIFENKEEEFCWYYTDKLSFYYMFSRTYFNGVNSLGISRDIIIKRVLSFQRDDGSFGNVLSTAFAVCTLLNFDFEDNGSVERALCYILNNQRGDGAWERSAFFTGPQPPKPHSVWWGSEELTTAICIEALARYRFLLKK